jgi:hypothetical protein
MAANASMRATAAVAARGRSPVAEAEVHVLSPAVAIAVVASAAVAETARRVPSAAAAGDKANAIKLGL